MTLPFGRQAVDPSVKDIASEKRPLGILPLALTVAVLGICAGAYLLIPAVRLEINRLIFVLSMADVDAARGWIGSAGPWAPVVSILVMVFQAVLAPLPAVIITFANAALFGWVWGAVLSWTGAMIGAAICYGLAVGLGRSLVERVTPTSVVARLDRASSRYGIAAILIARLLPFVPFDPVSYAAGLLRLRFVPFLVATGVGQLPATIVYSLAGDLLAVNAGLLAGGIVFVIVIVSLVALLRATPIGRFP